MYCNLCKSNNNNLLKPNEKFLDTELSNVVKNILAVHTIKLPMTFLICTECALTLLQTEIVLSRLRKAILNDKRESTAKENENGEESDENNLDITNTSSSRVNEEYLSAFGSNTLLLDWKFHCTHCEYTSNKAKWYKRHLITKHQLKDARIYQCPYCNESYKRLLGIKSHLDSVHGNKPRQKRIRRKTSLLSRNSNDERKVLGNETYLNDSKANHENDPYEFECSICDHNTVDAQLFKTHLEIKHNMNDSKIYKCKKCPLKFIRKSTLDNHIACKHNNTKNIRSCSEKRKSVTANFALGTIENKEIEINDVKDEEVSEAETEVHLGCKHCTYEAEDTKELQRHQDVIHQKVYNVKEKFILPDTLNDDKQESDEERAIEIEKVDKKENKVNNTKITPINDQVMVSIPVKVASEEGRGLVRNLRFSGSFSFQKFRDTQNDEPLMISQIANMTQGDSEEHSNKINLHSTLSKTPSFPKFRDTQNDKPLMGTQIANMTQGESEEHSNKLNLHSTLSKTPIFPKFRDTQNDKPLMGTQIADMTQGESEEHSNKLNLHSTMSKTQSFPKFQDTQNDKPLMGIQIADMTQGDSEEHTNNLNLHSTLSKTQSFPKFQDTQNDEPLMISQIANLTQSDSEEHSLQTPEKNLRNKFNLHSTLKKIPNEDVDSEKSDNMEATFETPKKILPHQINTMELSKTDWVFLCSNCDFESTQKKGYREHIKFEHDSNDENIYKCLYCTSSFIRYKSLKTHVSTMHAMDLTGTCETPATFSDSSQDQSRRTRQGARKRKSSVEVIKDNESSNADANVSPIQLAKRKKLLSCVVCGKIFSSAEKLQKHLNKLHSADEMCQ